MNQNNPDTGGYAGGGQSPGDLPYDDPFYGMSGDLDLDNPYGLTPYGFGTQCDPDTQSDFGSQGAPSQVMANESPAGVSMDPVSTSDKPKKTPAKKTKSSPKVKEESSNMPVQQTPSGALGNLYLGDDMDGYDIGDFDNQGTYGNPSQYGVLPFGQSQYSESQDRQSPCRQSSFTPSPYTPSKYSSSSSSLPVLDPEWDYGATPRDSGRLTYRYDTLGDDAPTVDDPRVKKSQNNIQKYKTKAKTTDDPNGRQKGRNLVQWGRPNMFAKLCLHIQYECWLKGIQIPWDEVAQRLNPGSSGPAILQALNRTRDVLIAKGHMIPPNMGTFKAVRADQIRGYVHDDTSESPWAVVPVRWDDETYQDPQHEREDDRIAWGSGKYPRGKGAAPKHLRPSSKRFRIPDEDKAKIKEEKTASTKKRKSKAKTLVKKELESDDEIDPALLKSDEEYDPSATKSKRKRGAQAGGSRKKSRLEIDGPEMTPTKAGKSKDMKANLSAPVVLRISPYALMKFPIGESGNRPKVEDNVLGARVRNRPDYVDDDSAETDTDNQPDHEVEVEESDGDDQEIDIDNQVYPLSPGVLDFQNPYKQTLIQTSVTNARTMQPSLGHGAGLSRQTPAGHLSNDGDDTIQQDQEDIFRHENPGEGYTRIDSPPPHSLDPNQDAVYPEPMTIEEQFLEWEEETRQREAGLNDINREIGEAAFDLNEVQNGGIESSQHSVQPLQQQGPSQARQGPRPDDEFRFYTPEGYLSNQKGLYPYEDINYSFDPFLSDQPLSDEEIAAAVRDFAPGGQFYQGPKSDRAQ